MKCDVDLNAQRSVFRLLLEILLATSSEPVGNSPIAQPIRTFPVNLKRTQFPESMQMQRLKQTRDWPSDGWETRYFGTLGLRRARIGRHNVSNVTTSQLKTRETKEAHRKKK